MATMITSECINCGACEPECPNTAIYQGAVEWQAPDGAMHPALSSEIFYIVPEKCTECVGFHDHEACAAVCPVDCCVPEPGHPGDARRAAGARPGAASRGDHSRRRAVAVQEGGRGRRPRPAAAPAAPPGGAAPAAAPRHRRRRRRAPRRRGLPRGPARRVGQGREGHRAASAAPAEDLRRRAARRLRPDRHRARRAAPAAGSRWALAAARPARGRAGCPRRAAGRREAAHRGGGGRPPLLQRAAGDRRATSS